MRKEITIETLTFQINKITKDSFTNKSYSKEIYVERNAQDREYIESVTPFDEGTSHRSSSVKSPTVKNIIFKKSK